MKYTASMGELFLGLENSSKQKMNLDVKALTTHGFVLGMTGSGKTGVCVVMIEELLRQGIPVLAVDSKGDLGTLLLNFAPNSPELQTWTPDAAKASERISAALEAAGMPLDKFSELKKSYDARLYTPGSNIGLPIDLLGSLAPPADLAPESVAESSDGVVRGLLGLLGVEADPLTSREYLLLVQIISTLWQQGQTPSLIDLVKLVANPPFQTVGALPLDDFFPSKDRSALMIRMNGLLASPKFAAWRSGEPFDLNTLLKAPDGRPRLSIFSVAHLSDEERLFAVAQLLERTQTWMRKQGGSSAVRAVILIDEIFGYFPPSPANPPTKQPLLALLKQARAFGVSIVLATQNPIDLDYRGLANIGTWLVGRLQTEQDKNRIRDALMGAAAASQTTPAQIDSLIATLEPRKFLLHSVHRPVPTVFASRDAWTYLRGPFSADEIKALTAPMKPSAAPVPTSATSSTGAPSATPVATGANSNAAAIPLGLDPELGPIFEVDQGQALPFLMLKFGVRYRVGTVISEETVHEIGFPLSEVLSPAEILEGTPYGLKGVSFQNARPPHMTLVPMPNWVAALKLSKLQSTIKERLPSKLETKLYFDAQTKMLSAPNETVEAFTARVVEKQGVSKDASKLLKTLEKKKADMAQAEKDVSARKAEKWANVGAGVLGFLVGRSRSLSSVGKAMTSQRNEGTAESKVQDLQIEISQLEQDVSNLNEIDVKRFAQNVAVPKPADVQMLRCCYAFIVP
jgi:hypothetical protein